MDIIIKPNKQTYAKTEIQTDKQRDRHLRARESLRCLGWTTSTSRQEIQIKSNAKTDTQTEKQTDRQTPESERLLEVFGLNDVDEWTRDTNKEKRKDRYADRQTDRQTGRQTGT